MGGPMNSFYDAFISYGRADSRQFAKRLYDCLVDRGFEIWFDFEDIPLGVDYQKQIDDGIEKADNFIFIISPHAVHSSYCLMEIEQALKLNKRIVPLLHVEEISYTTWKQRNPGGEPDVWRAYKGKGRHSSFTHLHPEIRKINWVYFREGVDDFETALERLVEIFEHQEDYVRNHTYFLSKALVWEHHQKQVRYLLRGETCQAAAAWLKVRFQQEQPPCVPTDLHCEFVTESMKLANRWMTQVFLCVAQADLAVKRQVRSSLMREGFTVWCRFTDVQLGEDVQVAVRQGIEIADNLVYLLSPEAVRSQDCQQQLNYALSLHKRIIPIKLHPVEPDQLPAALKNLQSIDLSDDGGEANYDQGIKQLFKALRQNSTYYQSHKLLLVKTLQWERQKRNPSILLKGQNLRQFESWFKIAQRQERHRPTPLQQEFLRQSLQQPHQPLDVFICYCQADQNFATEINHALQLQGKTTWFDRGSIALDTEFQQEVYRGIEDAEHVVLVMSPDATNSYACLYESKYAQVLDKRIIPLLYRVVSPAFLPPWLAKLQWIDFTQDNIDFLIVFGELLSRLGSSKI